jgi:hypothetical protein
MIKVTKLEWPAINRILDIISYAPCQTKEGDAELMERTGLFQYYDQDRDTIELVKGAEEAFLEYVPQARVRNEWRSDKILPTEREAILGMTTEEIEQRDCNVANNKIQYKNEFKPNII